MDASIHELERHCARRFDVAVNTSDDLTTAPFAAECVANLFQRMTTLLRPFSTVEQVIYTLIYATISLIAIIGNGLVIIVVIRKKSMRTNRNVLIVNLAICNMLLALLNVPLLWLPSVDFNFPFRSSVFCKFANALPGSNIYCSTLTICVMAIDRYYTVRRMSMSNGSEKPWRTILMAIMIWMSSFLLSLPLLIYYDISMLYAFENVQVYDKTTNTTKVTSYGWQKCDLMTFAPTANATHEMALVDEAEARAIRLAMSLMQVLFLYVVPLVVLWIFNARLTHFLKTRQMGRPRPSLPARGVQYTAAAAYGGCVVREHRMHDATAGAEPSTSSGGGTVEANGVMRPSDPRRSRTNRTTMLLHAMAASYALLWLPFTLVSLLIDLQLELWPGLQERVDQICKMLSMSSLCINVLLYAGFNTNFRSEFNDIFATLFHRSSTKRRRQRAFSARSMSLLPPSAAPRASIFSAFPAFWRSSTSLTSRPRHSLDVPVLQGLDERSKSFSSETATTIRLCHDS